MSDEFRWRHLGNQEITGIELEASKSISQESEILTGRAKTGLLLRISERAKNDAAFDELFEKMEFVLNNIYQDRVAPYPGQVTKSISCPAELRPRALPARDAPGVSSKGFLLMANGREVFGACDAGSIRFQAAYLLVGCKAEGVVYEIKMFLPAGGKSADQLERIYERFTCK